MMQVNGDYDQYNLMAINDYFVRWLICTNVYVFNTICFHPSYVEVRGEDSSGPFCSQFYIFVQFTHPHKKATNSCKIMTVKIDFGVFYGV